MNLMTSGMPTDESDMPDARSSFRSGNCRSDSGLVVLMVDLRISVAAKVPDKGYELPQLLV